MSLPPRVLLKEAQIHFQIRLSELSVRPTYLEETPYPYLEETQNKKIVSILEGHLRWFQSFEIDLEIIAITPSYLSIEQILVIIDTMNQLDADTMLSVLSFLAIPDILRLQSVSRGMYSVTDDARLWYEKATEMILPKDGMKYVLVTDDAPDVVEQLLFAQEDYASQLISAVSSVSSNDRAEESVSNVLSPSLCYSLKSSRRVKQHAMIPDDHFVYYTQLECGCMGNHPCYWSSAPSFTPTDEHITFSTSSTFALIQGIGITPYQAYFQPEQPVYAPGAVSLQLLHSNGTPYYTSPQFPIRAVFEHQYFNLPSPVVYIGGDMKLLFHGQQTRQTVSEAEGGQHHNSYYTCISHAVIGGVPIDEIRCTTKAVTADTIAVALSSAYAACL